MQGRLVGVHPGPHRAGTQPGLLGAAPQRSDPVSKALAGPDGGARLAGQQRPGGYHQSQQRSVLVTWLRAHTATPPSGQHTAEHNQHHGQDGAPALPSCHPRVGGIDASVPARRRLLPLGR
jgi:hypothetical protein